MSERIATHAAGAMSAPSGRARPAWEDRPLAWLLAALAVLTLARLAAVAAARTDLFFDEAQYWFWSRELAAGYYSKPPLIAWIIRASTDICGMGEACIRAPSAIIHAATALLIYAIGRGLYDARVGFWSGLVYATLPGVSFSAALISTDVPLLFCVALALLALIRMQDSPSWGWGALLGLGIGLGLNAKYAMSYFLMGLAIHAVATRDGRRLLRDARLYAALAIAAALIAPNIAWNAQNRFATFAHTADNANWGKSLINPGSAAEFVSGQLGVFGPVLFVCLLAFAWRWRHGAPLTGNRRAETMLLGFCLPVLALMTIQALLSRAHANWAAFAYIAATVLITAFLMREGWSRLFRASLALHLAIAALIPLGGALAGRIAPPGGADPYARVLGWRAVAEAAAEKAAAEGFRAIATDRRPLAAELLYYLRDRNLPVVALRGDSPPRDHFELTRPLNAQTPRPVLLVSFTAGKRDADPVGSVEVTAGAERRKIHFYRLRDERP